ncbi:MAG: response regulator [Thermodesulfobacteriota bacterium]
MAFNILVADDSETMRAVVKKVVTMAGVPVGQFLEASNGREALQLLEESWVDVILSDINMPEMSGMEFLRALKGSPELRNIPVILITTESSQARMAEAQRLGVAGYVRKPFQPETIKKLLDEVLAAAYDREPSAVPLAGGDDDGMDF